MPHSKLKTETEIKGLFYLLEESMAFNFLAFNLTALTQSGFHKKT